ncbi:MAG: transporter permease [Flavipsychrobacter sp.]|jgi:lipopolysaccharide transport system permease protein|nr:transporter permease [Flavipsychrobacter sp.]
MADSRDHKQWDITITPGRGNLNFNVKELWRYRDLLMMFVKKDIITVYKQTILGPIWFVVQPVLTSLMFLLVFNGIAKISTGAVPAILFYLLGNVLWSYFSETLSTTSRTFTDNASVFGKVYFPRLVLPLSKTVSGLVKFLIQFGLFAVFLLYYVFVERSVTPNWYMLLAPVWLFIIVLMSLGFGIIITSLTTKYRDLTFLISFGIQLAMFITPVIIPLSEVQGEKRIFFLLNPLTSLFEAFKYGFFGTGTLNWSWLIYSVVFTAVLLLSGILIFNRVEKKFIDTV